MGLEFRLETYDADRVDLPTFLQRLPEFFQLDDDGKIHLSCDGAHVGVTVWADEQFVHVIQYVASRETDALLGLIIRKLLSLNDSVVVHDGS